MNVAVFGGSFNPPHIGHVLAGAYVLSVHDVDELLVVPCFLHPLGKQLAPFEDRFAMSVHAMGWLPRTSVSQVERELGGASRTLRTIEHLRSIRPRDTFRLVVGADILLEGKRWHGFDRVLELAPAIILGRAGVELAGAPPPVLPEVSSTTIRDAAAAGRFEQVRSLLPRAVADYVESKHLYRENTGGA